MKTTTRDVQVQVGFSTESNSYSFLCPTCRLLVNKPATDLIMEILVRAGVRIITWTRPAELDEVKLGQPITHDDLLGFHDDLEGHRWLETEVARLHTLDSPDPTSRTT